MWFFSAVRACSAAAFARFGCAVLILIALAGDRTRAEEAGSAAATEPVQANGLLDLRDSGWNFSRDGLVSLDSWQFHPNRILAGDALQDAFETGTDVAVRFPGYWTGAPLPEGKMTRFGFGTLLFTIELPEPSQGLALQMRHTFSAYRIEVNGQALDGVGLVGMSRETERAAMGSRLIALPDGVETLRIAMPLSNFRFWMGGGMRGKVFLGSAEELADVIVSQDRLVWFLGGVLLILFVYHMALFAFRPGDRANLWFAILCFCFLGRLVTSWHPILHDYLGEGYYWLTIRVATLSAYTVMLFSALYVYCLYREEFSRRVLYFIVGSFVLFCAMAFLPFNIATISVTPAFMVTLFFVAYGAYVGCLAIIRRRSGGVLFLIAWVGFTASSIGAILNFAQITSSPNLLPFGFLFFVALQALLLSQRLSRSFNQVEALSQELSANNERLQRLDKLKDQFLANTSHELRTPLNGIIGLTDSLLAGAQGRLNRDVERTLDMISKSGRRLSSLVNDILDSAKLRNRDLALSRTAVDLHEAVDVVLHLSRPLIGTKPVRLQNAVPVDLPLLDADENRLQQILQNLVGNAIKFTGSGHIVVKAEDANDSVVIVVEDTGIGIPEDRREAIFESFEQVDASTERAFGGTGLGLSITRSLVELHGGRVWVESELGKGSRFYVEWPKAAVDGKEVARRRGVRRSRADAGIGAASAGSNGHRHTGEAVAALAPLDRSNGSGMVEKTKNGTSVLVVDDDEINRHVVANFLSLEAYDVIEAEDGVRALEIIDDHHPDLVLLDIMMPRLNGYEVCRRVRTKADQSNLPIIFLSAKDRADDLVAGFDSGGNDYITKPVSGPELLARVGTHARLTHIQSEAVRQEKLAAIGQMAAGIVHDFKNSIGVIKGYAEMLAEDDIEDRDEAAEFATTIASEADRISSMAYEILEFSRGQVSLNREDVSVEAFLGEVKAAIGPLFDRKGLDVMIADPPDARVSIDTRRMVRAFTNIAGNAADALAAGGRFSLGVRRAGDRIEFSLTDTGSGIPEEIRETLFDPFVTHGKAGGTGLGMALVKSTIEAHDGTIRFETATGEGTTFFVSLPAA